MSLHPASGHQLNIGDHVKMNIDALRQGDLDGVEFTATGKNYWRYMNEHPDEIYTVTAYDFSSSDVCFYVLSGYMADNTWAADELIHIPEPSSRFEIMKNLTEDEAPDFVADMVHALCEEGMPTIETIREWLTEKI